jgi:hypothetical protein
VLDAAARVGIWLPGLGDYAEIESDDDWAGCCNVLYRRAIGRPFPYPIDPLGPK